MTGELVLDPDQTHSAGREGATRVGFLTIGQSPRPDMTAPFAAFTDIDVLEAGALDDLVEEDRGDLQPSAGETTYISKLNTGAAVRISRKVLLPLLAAKLEELGSNVDAIVLACTGSFPELTSRTPVIYPDQLVSGIVQGLSFVTHLGLLAPLPEQADHVRKKWQKFPGTISVRTSSPYDGSDPADAAIKLKEQGATLIVLDCMGYSPWHRERIRAATGLPVILPQSILAANVRECFSGTQPEGTNNLV